MASRCGPLIGRASRSWDRVSRVSRNRQWLSRHVLSRPVTTSVSTRTGAAEAADPGTRFGIVSTKPTVEGRRIVREIGVVSAGDFRSKNLLQDVYAAILAMFGGETPAYSDLLDEASAGSTYKLMREAQGLGATDVVNVRYQTTSTMNRLIFGLHVSVMGYGTAVVTEPIPDECEVTYCAYEPSTVFPQPGQIPSQ